MDMGIGSRNGSVNSLTSRIPQSYEPRLRYNHMGILSHLPNGSIAAAWQVPLAASHHATLALHAHHGTFGAEQGWCSNFRHCQAASEAADNPSASLWGPSDRLAADNPCASLWGQATEKWYEGPADQGIYWAISDDVGLTWGPTRLMIPAEDSLPQWGPVLHFDVRGQPLVATHSLLSARSCPAPRSLALLLPPMASHALAQKV